MINEKDILQHLYDNNTGAYTNLLDFLIKHFPNDDSNDARYVRELLKELIDEEYIRTSGSTYESLDSNIKGTQNKVTLRVLKSQIGSNPGFDGIMAKILLKGKQEVERVKFAKDVESVNSSVVTTNWFSNISASISVLISIILIYLQLYTCHRDNLKDIAIFEKDKEDSLRQLRIEGNAIELNKKLDQISLCLSDTLQVKAKIEKRK